MCQKFLLRRLKSLCTIVIQFQIPITIMEIKSNVSKL